METDEEIYLRYMKKEDDADLETLLVRHRDGLFLFLLGFVKNSEDAEELLMDTFAKLAVDKPRFDPTRPGSFKSWLYVIGRNNALMHIRKGKMQTVPLDENLSAGASMPELEMLREERNRKLYQAIASLKNEYRHALTLIFLEGLSHEETAKVMGMSKPRLYNIVKRGKLSLRKSLEEMGIYDAQ